ncbi:MAG: hypothetical protein QXE79_04440 [Candidatus Bathyarchaeia archaeon]
MNETYRRLIEAWSNELNNSDLQALEDDFYVNIRKYLEGLKKLLEQEGYSSIECMLREKEFERAKSLFMDLIKRRIVKIFDSLVVNGVMPEESKLTLEEKNAIKHLEEFEKSLIEAGGSSEPHVKGNAKEKKGKGNDEILIRILRPLPKITGLNLMNYGPFETEDLATIPVDNADPLIKRGIAIRVNWGRGGSD